MRKIGKKTASLLVALGFLVVGSSMIFMSYWNNTEGTEKRIVEELRDFELPVYPSASGVKEYSLKGGYIQGVSYKANIRYPAKELLEFYEKEWAELGFDPYSEEYYDYADRNWKYLTNSKHERKSFVAQLLMSWADSTRTKRANLVLKYLWYGAAESFSSLKRGQVYY